MSLDPDWSERILDSGGPTQPLRAGTVRNGILGNITRAITTDVTLRGRYLSVFCWGQHLVETHPTFADATAETKTQTLYTLEKILALTTLRYQQEYDITSGTSGLVGKLRIDLDELLATDPVDLSAFTLRDGANAVELTKTNRYYLLLREGDPKLTTAGKELAETVDKLAGESRDRLVECLQNETVREEDLEAFASFLSLQTLYTAAETQTPEQAVLTRVFLGLLSWDEEANTATLDPLPESLDTRVSPYLQYETSEQASTEDLRDDIDAGFRDDVESEILRLQRAWSLFILQATQEYHSTPDDGTYQIDAVANTIFEEFRIVAKTYWLQEFAAVLLRQQLWLLCEYLERALPQPVPSERLFGALLTDQVNHSATAAFDISLVTGSNPASQERVTRELALYGRTPVATPEVVIPERTDRRLTSLGDLRSRISIGVADEWEATTPSVQLSTLVRALRQIVEPVDNVAPQGEIRAVWQQSLGLSLTVLVSLLERYRMLVDRHPLVGTYMQSQYGDARVSLPTLEEYVSDCSDEMPLADFARNVITDLVIDVHDYVVRDRAGNNNPIKLAFSHMADRDAYRYESGTNQLRREYLRHGLVQQTLLDIGLLTETGDDGMLTEAGHDVLLRARRVVNEE
jgi:dsDNA-binding SOS-regulon protein